MADYIDAGSIVAGSVGLVVWTQTFGLTSSTVGLLGAVFMPDTGGKSLEMIQAERDTAGSAD